MRRLLDRFAERRTRRSDVASSPDYAQRVANELEHFEDFDDFTPLPDIFAYWTSTYLLPRLKEVLHADGINEFFADGIERVARRGGTEVVSLGAGQCDIEIGVAELLRERGLTRFRIECVDLNAEMLEKGREDATARGVERHLTFEACDLADWRPRRRFDACIANHSLHHIVALEDVFASVKSALRPQGVFLVNDMIGRNGHMCWPETLEHVQRIWKTMPDRYKHNRQLERFEEEFDNWDCSQWSFEGIRAQDILPLLLREFHLESFLGFGGLVEVFIGRNFGPNFDAANREDLAFVDMLHALNDDLVDRGEIKPTMMIATLRPQGQGATRCFRHWTPEFCLRDPALETLAPRAQ